MAGQTLGFGPKQLRGAGFWVLDAIKFTNELTLWLFKKRLRPGMRMRWTSALIKSWLLLTMPGAAEEMKRLIVGSRRSPKPVNRALTVPTRTDDTRWTMFKFPLGKFLNWVVTPTSTLLTAMLMFPLPRTGAWTPISCVVVEWVPTIVIVGMLMLNLMIKPIIEKSKKEKHMLCWPVTSAFLNVKSMLILF